MFKQSRSNYGNRMLKRRILKKIIIIFLLVIVVIGGIWGMGFWRSRALADRQKLLDLWNAKSYSETLHLSHEGLIKRPMDPFFLTLYGLSAYQLALSQINTQDALGYIDECIWSLRKALLTKTGARDPRIPYVLGKAYFYKGPQYAELSVQYLEQASQSGMEASDIAEYLGLSYANLKDYRNSIIAFSTALADGENSGGPSDLLLLSIARSYLELGEIDSAKAYLNRCIETSIDSTVVVKARLLLGKTLIDTGEPAAAEREFLTIVEENEQNAEAHYQLGELYASAGDSVKARAEWRKALRIDPSYGPARARLSL